MNRRDLLSSSLGAAAMSAFPTWVLAQNSAATALQNRSVQQVITQNIQALLFNSGIAPSQGRIGFPLSGMSRPEFDIRFSPQTFGLDWRTPERFDEIDIAAIGQAFINQFTGQDAFNSMSPQQQQQMIEQAQRFNEALTSMTRTGLVVAGITITAAGVGAAAAVGSLAVASFGLSYMIAKDVTSRINEALSDDDDCDCPAQSGSGFMIPDMGDRFPGDRDGDGIPDDGIYPPILFSRAMARAGMLGRATSALGVGMSFEATGRGVGVTVALRSRADTSTGRFEIMS